MRRRIFVNRVQRPLPRGVLAAGDPLDCSPGLRGISASRLPRRANREIEPPVAVDVVRSKANIVLLGLALQDDMLGPARIFEPQNTLAIDDADIKSPIVV